ncbi:uncharacterized protein ABDE67_009629 [Symphorus nematophorus]
MSKILTDHGFLPLSSLRLIVPPLQLVCAALWEIVEQGAVVYYGLLEEFISTVLETVPELLTYTERVQLVMGLRAKVVLELCRNDNLASPQAIQPHLSRINTYISNQDKETSLWLSLSPSILKECVDFMNQPEPLNTLIQHHKHHGHKVPQVLSSSAGDCILSSLSYHLPKLDNDEEDKLVKSGFMCASQDWQKENFKEMNSESMRKVARNGQQHVDDLTEDQGASVEVILQPFDENDSQAKSQTIKCTMCEKNFSKIVLMKKHYSNSHKVRGSYPCPLCKRTFVRLCELVRHQQNKKLYQCAACKKCYTKPGLLNDHEKLHTASATPRVCETCGQSFKFLAHLILHQRKHRDRPPHVCSYCGKQFSTKDYLRAHMVRHTDGYPCPVCGKKFYQKTYLKWHLYKHTGQEPYLCDTCGKGWPSAAQLKLHMIQHTEERPFKCEDCGVCYKRESHLIAHRRAKHIQLRPFVCEVCSKAFRLNNELKKHMMVHTGERPFTCPRCGKTFTRKYRLREHTKKACL